MALSEIQKPRTLDRWRERWEAIPWPIRTSFWAILLLGGFYWLGQRSHPVVRRWPIRQSYDSGTGVMPGRIVLSPDGKTLAVCEGLRSAVNFLDLETFRSLGTWSDGQFMASGPILFSPDGKTLIAQNNQSFNANVPRLAIVDTQTFKTRALLKTTAPVPVHVYFSDDSQTFSGFLGDGAGLKEAITWNTADGSVVNQKPFTIPSNRMMAHQAISPDGRWHAAANWNSGQVLVRDLQTKREIGTITSAKAFMGYQGMTYSQDSRLLALGHGNGTISLHELPSLKTIKVVRAHSANHLVNRIVLSPDGQYLASQGVIGFVPSLSERFLVGVRTIMTGASWEELVILNLKTEEILYQSSGGDQFHQFTPDGKSTLSTYQYNRIDLREIPYIEKPTATKP